MMTELTWRSESCNLVLMAKCKDQLISQVARQNQLAKQKVGPTPIPERHDRRLLQGELGCECTIGSKHSSGILPVLLPGCGHSRLISHSSMSRVPFPFSTQSCARPTSFAAAPT